VHRERTRLAFGPGDSDAPVVDLIDLARLGVVAGAICGGEYDAEGFVLFNEESISTRS